MKRKLSTYGVNDDIRNFTDRGTDFLRRSSRLLLGNFFDYLSVSGISDDNDPDLSHQEREAIQKAIGEATIAIHEANSVILNTVKKIDAILYRNKNKREKISNGELVLGCPPRNTPKLD
ncbi:hypothetical protein ACFL3T_02390 [Patescibacteria group bacterium]